MAKPKKLKRGLSDISKLFSKNKSQSYAKDKNIYQTPVSKENASISYKAPEQIKLSVEPGTSHCFGLYSAGSYCSQQELATHLAAIMTKTMHACQVLSFQNIQRELITYDRHPEYPSTKQLRLSWEKWIAFRQEHSSERHHPENQQSNLILSLPFMDVAEPMKMASVVDRWIVHVGAELDSMMDAYRFIKSSVHKLPGRDYYFLYDGPLHDRRAEKLFEEFSLLVAEQLDVHLIWVGSALMGRAGMIVSSELHLDPLFLETEIMQDVSDRKQLGCYLEQCRKIGDAVKREERMAV